MTLHRHFPKNSNGSNFLLRLSSCKSLRICGGLFLGTFTGMVIVAKDSDEPNSEPLTLKAVIAQALEHNADIKVDDLAKIVEQEKVKVAKLSFDPHLDGSYIYQSIDTPQNAQEYVATGGGTVAPSNPAQPSLASPNIFEERNHVGKISLSEKLPTGTILELGSSVKVLDNSLNRQTATSIFHPEWESFSGLTITQPLWRGFGINANMAEIRIAKSNVKLADLEWQAKTVQVVAEVMKRYYDVIFTRENMKVQRDGIALAKKLMDDTSKRSKEGVAATNDVLVAEAGVYSRQEEALAAEMQYIERQNALQLLYKRADDVISKGSRVEPVDQLLTSVPETNRGALLGTALAKRFEIQQADEAIGLRGAQVQLAKNQSRPKLDLVASGGYHGLSGSFGSTYDKAVGDGQGPEWTVGMQFSLPLNFDHANSGHRLAESQEVQAHVQREKVKLQIALEVDTALGRLRADRQRVTATTKSREAAAQSAEGELKRLHEGVTTSYQVLQLQKEYSQSRSRELAALVDLNKDLVDLYLTTGTLLEKNGITISNEVKGANTQVPAAAVVAIPAKQATPVKNVVPAAAADKKPTANKSETDVKNQAVPKKHGLFEGWF